MSARRAIVLVLAKMALADGKVAEQEREFLAPLLTGDDTVDALLDEASGKTLEDLVGGLDKYADRFFVALRAKTMALIDEDFDEREQALYADLIRVLEITSDDASLIEKSVDALSAVSPTALDPRIEELYQQSSFL